jgi:hypothetical protein
MPIGWNNCNKTKIWIEKQNHRNIKKKLKQLLHWQYNQFEIYDSIIEKKTALIPKDNPSQHFEISYSRYANKHYITGVYITINDSYR